MSLETYTVVVECENCGKRYIVDVPIGIAVKDLLCKNCQLAELKRVS